MRSPVTVLAVAVLAALVLILSRGEFGAAPSTVRVDAQAAGESASSPEVQRDADSGSPDLAVIESAAERSEAVAGAGGAPAASAPEFPMARLVGRVIDEEETPVSGLEVDLMSSGTWREGVVVPTFEVRGSDARLWRVETATDGCFSFDVPVPTADWVMLSVEGDPFFGIVGRDFGHAGGRKKPPIVEGVNDLGDIVVPRTGALTGVVTDVDGVPIERAIVTLDGSYPGGRVINTRTDALGRYALGHVPPGPTSIQARHERFLLESKSGVTVVAQQSLEGPSFALVPAPAIGGIVVDEEGAPLAKIRIWGWPSGSGRGAGATSDADGRFVIYLPQDEPYILEADRDSRFVPWGGRGVEDSRVSPGTMDLRIELVRASRLEVHVVDAVSEDPIERFSVEVRGEKSSGGARMGEHAGGVVDVPASPGAHTLIVKSPGYAASAVEVAFDAPPAEGEIGVQTVRLVRGASVTGRVTLDGEGVPAAQVTFGPQPLPKEPGGTVDPDDIFGDTWRYDVEGEAARGRDLGTGADGVFRIEGVAPGTYRLIAKGAGGSPRAIENMVVEGQTDVELGDVELLAEATLIGQIRLAGGESAVGLEVSSDFPHDRESIVESADGTFTLRGLAPGEHSLSIASDGHRLLQVVQREFTIAAGETKRLVIDLTEQAVFEFTARVRNAGAPLAGVSVTLDSVHEHEGRTYVSEGARIGPTDADGVARGSVTAGRPIVAVVREGRFEIGRSAVVVPRQGGDEDVVIDVSFGALVIELPEGFELPDDGVLNVSMRPDEPSADQLDDPFFGHEQFWTQGSTRSGRHRPWSGRRHEVGRVAVGRYRLTVRATAFDGGASVGLFEPYSTVVEIVDGETAVVQVPR